MTTIASKMMNEVILYGGIPMTRANVYRQALVDTGSKKAADMFAFSTTTKVAPSGTRPLTLVEFRKVTGSIRRKARRGR